MLTYFTGDANDKTDKLESESELNLSTSTIGDESLQTKDTIIAECQIKEGSPTNSVAGLNTYS